MHFLRLFAASLLSLMSAALAPAVAAADVIPHGSPPLLFATGDTTIPANMFGSGPDETIVLAFSTQGEEVVSVNWGDQPFERVAHRAVAGARSEIWVLANAQWNEDEVSIDFAGSTAYLVAIIRFTGVHDEAPILATGDAASPAVLASGVADVSLPEEPRLSDRVVALLTAANPENMKDLAFSSPISGGMIWDAEFFASLSPLIAIRGGIFATTDISFEWTWQPEDPTLDDPWTAVAVALRAADPAKPTSLEVSAITKTSATLSASVLDDGGNAPSERGFVYCTCADPERGDPGVVDLPADGGGLGEFSVGATGLEHGVEYTVRAYAVNSAGTAYSAAVTFVARNNAPTGAIGGPFEVVEGEPLTLDATATDADGDEFDYSWDVNGDGVYGDAAGASPTLGPEQLKALGLGDGPATSAVRVRLGDGEPDGETVLGPAALTVLNAPPTAALEGDTAVPGPGEAKLIVKLADPGDDTVTGRVDWGDGTVDAVTGPGETPVSHVYASPGEKTVTLTAVDDDGAVADPVQLKLTVAEPPEVCFAGKLRLSTAEFRPTGPFGTATRVPGIRARLAVNGHVSARILPRLIFRDRRGRRRAAALRPHEVSVRGSRQLRFRLPRRAKRLLRRPLVGQPVTLVIHARLARTGSPNSCPRQPVTRRLRTKVVRVSGLAALSRVLP